MKKKLITAAILTFVAIALVVTTVFVTVAVLTASSAVSNVFTVGNVEISMYETKVDSVKGEAVSPYTEVDSNSYHLVPKMTYTKDPTIRIMSKLEQDEMYLFVKSFNQIREIEAGNQPDATDETPLSMRAQMEANGWVEYVRSGDGIEIVWVYGRRDVTTGEITPIAVNPESQQIKKDGTNGPKGVGDFVLCEEFTVAENANVALYAAAKVNFTSFAIQTKGVKDIHDAWTTIKSTYPFEGGIVNPVNPYDTTQDPYAPIPGVDAPVPLNS